ncbi:unnamed protein product [Cylicostephanus goldi]|uniref:Reverse transcriptase domain-containing protein n=1 Tax=Cylicostephanus goldi TaxID=71465 RepID=A0A3P6SG60_CYLGO|nr:unnamed protein product [Cylicostephanus goldi]
MLKKDSTLVSVLKRNVPFAVELSSRRVGPSVATGVLSPFEYSQCAAPIVPDKKKNGTLRICADFSTCIEAEPTPAAYCRGHLHQAMEEPFSRISTFMLLTCNEAVAYLDDGARRNREEHDANVFKLIQRLQDCGMRVRREKCYFAEPSIVFYGFIVDAEGRRPTLRGLPPSPICHRPDI